MLKLKILSYYYLYFVYLDWDLNLNFLYKMYGCFNIKLFGFMYM